MVFNDVDDKIYVGSTERRSTRSLNKRFRLHKETARNISASGYNMLLCKHIREIGSEHFDIMLLEEIDNTYTKELRLLEDEWYSIFKDTGKNVLNSRRPGTGLNKKEYFRQWKEDNREKYEEQVKRIYRENKDKYNENRRNKRSKRVTCPNCNELYSGYHISKHKKKCCRNV